MIRPTNHMELKKKEDQNIDVSVLHRIGNKMIIGSRGQMDLGGNHEGGKERES